MPSGAVNGCGLGVWSSVETVEEDLWHFPAHPDQVSLDPLGGDGRSDGACCWTLAGGGDYPGRVVEMSTPRWRRTKTLSLGLVAGLALGSAGGVAWSARDSGSGTQQARPFQYAATFQVTAPLNGDVVEVPWPTFGNGRITFHSNCGAAFHPASEGVPAYNGVAGLTLGVRNESADRIGIAASGSDAPPGGFFWLQPKGTPPPEYGFSDFYPFGVGELVNDVQPDGVGGTYTVAILDQGGTSASGTFAWAASFDTANNVGRCTFSLQLKG